jgi:predicted acetyltransferase
MRFEEEPQAKCLAARFICRSPAALGVVMLATMPFQFLDAGPLIDHELELVGPDARWVDALLRSCQHPLSASDPTATAMTRSRALDVVRAAPQGKYRGDPKRGQAPYYYFWMHLREPSPPIEIAGSVSLRIGDSLDLQQYVGNIGYNVYPPARGRHYAERASRLILTLARAHGMQRLWITCNPENWASRRTCERLGAAMIDIVAVPSDHPLHQRGEREKCRYLLEL